METLQRAMDLLTRKDAALAPVEEFHKAVEDANQNDVRIFWDVHIVRGSNTPLKRVRGSSSLPDLLSKKMVANAPSIIQQEIVEKIAMPLTGAFMLDRSGKPIEGGESHPIGLLPDSPAGSIDPERSSGGDLVMELADEHEEEDEGGATFVPAEKGEE